MHTEIFEAWKTIQRELKIFVFRKVHDKATAEDIIQDVFLKIQTRAHQLNDIKKAPSWIYQITRNTITDYFRSQSKVSDLAELDWESSSSDFNECVAYYLKRLLTTLPDKYREALEMVEIQDLTQQELAGRLHISPSGARSRVQRARKMLKERISQYFRIETDAYGNVVVCENYIPCECQKNC